MPRELIYLKNITRWRMVQMKIGGSVEGIFDAWGELQKLELASNEIQGALPALSGTRHPDLRELLLRDNQFSDEIPSNYSSLISLSKYSGRTLLVECDPPKDLFVYRTTQDDWICLRTNSRGQLLIWFSPWLISSLLTFLRIVR